MSEIKTWPELVQAAVRDVVGSGTILGVTRTPNDGYGVQAFVRGKDRLIVIDSSGVVRENIDWKEQWNKPGVRPL